MSDNIVNSSDYNQNNQTETTETCEGIEQTITIKIRKQRGRTIALVDEEPVQDSLGLTLECSIPLVNNEEDFDALPDDEKDIQIASQIVCSAAVKGFHSLSTGE